MYEEIIFFKTYSRIVAGCDAFFLCYGFPDKLLCILEYNTQFSTHADDMW